MKNEMLLLLLLQVMMLGGDGYQVRPMQGCSAEMAECHITLYMHNTFAMMNFSSGILGTMQPVEIDNNGTYFVKDQDCMGKLPMTEEAASRVITGDGSHRLLITYNNSLPGPTIVVYEHQMVVVNVVNALLNEPTTAHWHGLYQLGTPTMDGGATVSHCLIQPGEKFTYRFRAEPAGTSWYHSHHATQRTMGAYGPFIVLPTDYHKNQQYADDFYLVVSDYMTKTSPEILLNAKFKATEYAYSYGPGACYDSTTQVDGADCGVTPFISAVINGKGRHYMSGSDTPTNPGLPLETFKVRPGHRYRFRVICASLAYGFRLSVDGHDLNIIASDSMDTQELKVESLVIFSGERYDFYIETSDPWNAGAYWIRAQTLETYQSGQPIRPGHVEAILLYDGNDDGSDDGSAAEPVTSPRPCTSQNPCTVLNCPFQAYPQDYNITCIPVTALRTKFQPVPRAEQEVVEYFLNFHFTGFDSLGVGQSTINGRQMMLPVVPPQLLPKIPEDAYMKKCPEEQCNADWCLCTNVLKVPLNRTIQMVFFASLPSPGESRRIGMPHPIHLHAHRFEVIKVGWGVYNNTGLLNTQSDDIKCLNANCNLMAWSDPSWSTNLPDSVRSGAVMKDTVILPIGGYVVVRFPSENPGFWLLHCHTELHSEVGMALVVQEGETEDMPEPPISQLTCTNSVGALKQYQTSKDWTNTVSKEIKEYQLAIVVMIIVTILAMLFMLYMYCKQRPGTVATRSFKNEEYTPLTN